MNVIDGITEAANLLQRRFGLARARELAAAWVDQDPRWDLVRAILEERAGIAVEFTV
jgi:serine phosphatase RsbU (regulator of sigma subunit)